MIRRTIHPTSKSLDKTLIIGGCRCQSLLPQGRTAPSRSGASPGLVGQPGRCPYRPPRTTPTWRRSGGAFCSG
eukprot:9272713-Pyramimonas_sp.AAC.1